MGNPAGVRRDFETLERRRMEAARLLRQGLGQSEVARAVGVHRQSVSRWALELDESGMNENPKPIAANPNAIARPIPILSVVRVVNAAPTKDAAPPTP